jgi:hypothetical protein
MRQKWPLLTLLFYSKIDKLHFFRKFPKLVILTLSPGTDVMIFKIFSPKIFGEKIGVFVSKQS